MPHRPVEATGNDTAASGTGIPGSRVGGDYPYRVKILYENYKGVRRSRVVVPIKIEYRTSKYHPGTQWIMDAHDCEDAMKVKDFALCGLYPAWEIAEMEEPASKPDAGPPYPRPSAVGPPRQQRLPGVGEETMR
jgi:hypothetical protein